MSRPKIFSFHHDLGHSIMYEDTTAEYVESVGVPGKFVKKVNRRVHLKDGTSGEMDGAFIAKADGKILKNDVAVCFECELERLTYKKADQIGNYQLQLVVDHHMPTLVVVASPEDNEKYIQEIQRSPSDIVRFYFPDLGVENLSKRLNTVTEIINNNKVLTRKEAINLGIIVLYAPKNRGCEMTEKVVGLYTKISHTLDQDMQYVLYSVICVMIDYFFDDEKEYQRLINMMSGVTSQKNTDRFDSEIRIEEMYRNKLADELADYKAKLAECYEIIESLQEQIQLIENKYNGK